MTASVVQSRPGWSEAIANLRDLHLERGTAAQTRALAIASQYEGKRAIMVFDAVASPQRQYATRVKSMIETFTSEDASQSLAALASTGPQGSYGFRRNEAATMRHAEGLASYCTEHGFTEDEGVRAWAVDAGTYTGATKLDPYVGAVAGIGPALFSYLRMLSGARDAIKPDSRVRNGLRGLGFNLPGNAVDTNATLFIANAAAQETGIELVVLDQLLWDDDSPGPNGPNT